MGNLWIGYEAVSKSGKGPNDVKPCVLTVRPPPWHGLTSHMLRVSPQVAGACWQGWLVPRQTHLPPSLCRGVRSYLVHRGSLAQGKDWQHCLTACTCDWCSVPWWSSCSPDAESWYTFQDYEYRVFEPFSKSQLEKWAALIWFLHPRQSARHQLTERREGNRGGLLCDDENKTLLWETLIVRCIVGDSIVRWRWCCHVALALIAWVLIVGSLTSICPTRVLSEGITLQRLQALTTRHKVTQWHCPVLHLRLLQPTGLHSEGKYTSAPSCRETLIQHIYLS